MSVSENCTRRVWEKGMGMQNAESRMQNQIHPRRYSTTKARRHEAVSRQFQRALRSAAFHSEGFILETGGRTIGSASCLRAFVVQSSSSWFKPLPPAPVASQAGC